MKTSELIEKADEEVSFFDLLRSLGIHHPEEGRSYKGRCPFEFEHADGGVERAFRTYPATNSGYCFAEHGYLTSSRLMAIAWHVSRRRAAEKLLQERGLLRPDPWRKRWAALQAPPERAEETTFETAAEALRLRCLRIEGFAELQLDDPVIEAVNLSLTELAQAGSDIDSLRQWLDVSEQRVREAVWISTKSPSLTVG